MTSTPPSLLTSDQQLPGLAESEDARPRIILAADGTLCYANGAFRAYFPAAQKDIEGHNILNFISILDEGMEPGDGDAGESASLSRLQDGAYDIALPGFNMLKTYQFNWVRRGADGPFYLLGSEIRDEEDFNVPSKGQQDGDVENERPEWLLRALEKAPAGQAFPVKDEKSPVKSPAEVIIDDPWEFLNLSGELMVIISLDGGLSRVNRAFNTLLAYKDRELAECSLFDFIHEEDKSEARHSVQALAHQEAGDGARVIEFEVRMLDSMEEIHHIQWRMSLHHGAIYGVGHDRTAEKEHEKELEQREAQLSEAQAIGRMGHWHWQVGAGEIQWSRQIYRIFGVEKQDFHPSLDNVNSLLHKRDVGRLLQAFQRAIIEQNNYDMDFRVLRPDGETRNVRCEGRCEIDDQGEVVALFGIMQDITERVENEKVLRKAKESAERAYAAKSQFLANMSHELRTPLNAIIGFSEMMQRQLLGPIGTEKYLDYITGIRESGEHLLDLISDILDMSKIEAGKYTLDLEQLNLSKTIRLAVHMMEGRALDSGIKLTPKIHNEDLVINADRRALMQILLNIISNAVKFTESDGEVSVEAIERDHYLSIKIRDTGVGIPPNKLSSIIRPFEQVSNHYSREHQGSGLGLAITKELVELHNGSLSIDSEVGKGTVVTVRLPYDAAKKKMARAKN